MRRVVCVARGREEITSLLSDSHWDLTHVHEHPQRPRTGYISLVNQPQSCIFLIELIHEKSTTVALTVFPKTAAGVP